MTPYYSDEAWRRERDRLDGLIAELPKLRREAMFAEALRVAKERAHPLIAPRLTVDSPWVKDRVRREVKRAEQRAMQQEEAS